MKYLFLTAVMFLFFAACTESRPEIETKPNVHLEAVGFCQEFLSYTMDKIQSAKMKQHKKDLNYFNNCESAKKTAGSVQKKFILCVKPYEPQPTQKYIRDYYMQQCISERIKNEWVDQQLNKGNK